MPKDEQQRSKIPPVISPYAPAQQPITSTRDVNNEYLLAPTPQPVTIRSLNFRKAIPVFFGLIASFVGGRASGNVTSPPNPPSESQPSRLSHDGKTDAAPLQWHVIEPTDQEVLQMKSDANLPSGTYLVVRVVAASSDEASGSNQKTEEFYRALESAVGVHHPMDSDAADSFSADGLAGSVKRYDLSLVYYISAPIIASMASPLVRGPIAEFLGSLAKDVAVTILADGLIDATKKLLGVRRGDSPANSSESLKPTAPVQPSVEKVILAIVTIR